jgi:hypothetical protein
MKEYFSPTPLLTYHRTNYSHYSFEGSTLVRDGADDRELPAPILSFAYYLEPGSFPGLVLEDGRFMIMVRGKEPYSFALGEWDWLPEHRVVPLHRERHPSYPFTFAYSFQFPGSQAHYYRLVEVEEDCKIGMLELRKGERHERLCIDWGYGYWC